MVQSIKIQAKMRFSLVQLFLLFPAWCLAYLVAPYTTFYILRITWKHGVAANDIKDIRFFTEHQLIANPGLKFDDLDFDQMWEARGGNVDPWGNPYQVIERSESTDGLKTTVHAYSFGQDGKSLTQGNDPDDINSWNDHWRGFYLAQIERDKRLVYLKRTLWLTPLCYVVILIGYRIVCSLSAFMNYNRVTKI